MKEEKKFEEVMQDLENIASELEKGELDFTKSEMEILSEIFKKFNKKYTIEEIFFNNNFAISE